MTANRKLPHCDERIDAAGEWLEVLAALERGGWTIVRSTGSHPQLRHPERPGRVTLAVHGNETLHPKTLRSILNQANMTRT
jgi:predicted RNA binding protein YcfA (HicA-like mRNA interferase family)